MKYRPIIFTPESVRGILDGQKTMTRRVIKFILNEPHVGGCPPNKLFGDWALSEVGEIKNGVLDYACQSDVDDSKALKIKCPYGVPGSVLWVRETLYNEDGDWVYKADSSWAENLPKDWLKKNCHKGVIPSIFMPRLASRINLEIISIKVERVQDISEADARAEGFYNSGYFAEIWDSINAKRGYGWNINSWVWVIEFKLIT